MELRKRSEKQNGPTKVHVGSHTGKLVPPSNEVCAVKSELCDLEKMLL